MMAEPAHGLAGRRNRKSSSEAESMNREYHKCRSSRLGREMELLVFGHSGLPVLVFPTSGGRFYEFEDRGMIAAVAGKVDAGQLQFFCVDSVNDESWYNWQAPPRQRIARHMQYEEYLLHELVPIIRQKNRDPRLIALGLSFGGYHAVNIALRHPEIVSGFVSLSGTFDLTSFLDGYYDQNCYFHLPTHYLPRLTDHRFLDRFRRNRFVLATGWDDQCLGRNQDFDRILNEKGIAHEFHVWDLPNSHDWPAWQRMTQQYL
jgi:esterase/lipase superfamily enzyme